MNIPAKFDSVWHNYENASINGMKCQFDTQIEACTNEDPRIFGVYDRDGRGV
jgi:hypothetical protein